MKISKRALAVTGLALAIAAGGSAAFASGALNVTVSGSTFTSVTPQRVADSRSDLGITGPLAPMKAVTLTLSSETVPADATSVVLHLTVTGSSTIGYIAAGTATTPTTSSVNYGPGQTNTADVTVPVNDDKVSFYNYSTGTVQLIVDLSGYYAAPVVTSTYTPTATSFTQISNVKDHPDSGNNGGNWAVDNITRTSTVVYQGSAPVANCGSSATSCYLYEGSINDTGTYTTASSNDVTTDGLSPNKSVAINGTETGGITGSSAVEFYASVKADGNSLPPTSVSGVVSGEQTTTNWVEQFFPAGTTFGNGPDLLNWSWSYSETSPANCETWTDAYNGETGDITGVDACNAS